MVLVSIEKIYQKLKTVFDHISKHLEVGQKYSAARRIFNSVLGVWKCGQIRSFVFDILHSPVDRSANRTGKTLTTAGFILKLPS